MSVSIIIPALNEAAIICQAVSRAQATGPHEVIVADGGSYDATATLAESAGAKVLSAARGRASQQNAAARLASGDILLFLHADNYLATDGIRQIERACADTRIGCGAFKQAIQAPGCAYRFIEHGNAWRAARRGLPYGDQGIFVRHALFDAIGGFPELKLMEDVFLMRQMRRRSWPVLLPGPLYVSARRWQRQGVIRQTLRNWSLLAAARVGVHPDRLARFYQPRQHAGSGPLR